MDCFVLKDKLQALVEAGDLKLQPEQKMVTTNATSCILFGQFPSIPTIVNPIPKAELQILSIDMHQCQKKWLVPVFAPNGGIIWVHPDLVEIDGQWTTTSRKKSKSKGKAKPCHMDYASDSDGSSLFNTDDEEVASAIPIVAQIPCLKKHDDAGSVPSNLGRSPTQICLLCQYSFKEEHVGLLFEFLDNRIAFWVSRQEHKLKFLAAPLPEEVGRANHSNYYLFH